MESEHFDVDEETDEYIVECGCCGANVRVDSMMEATEYAMRPGKPCSECKNDGESA